jgi:hypothetical protein
MLDANKARDKLEDILNTQEYKVYHNDSKGWIETLWEKAKEWIASQLAKLFPSIESVSGAARPILIVIIVAVIILLALAIFFIIRNGRRNRMLRNQKPLRSMKEINWSYQKHLDEAGRLEALKEYTPSTRHLFLALLLYFHEKKWLEARIWKTNWEYYDELRKVNQQWADQFYDLASFFDEVTYGERKVQKEEFIQFRTEARKLLGETELLHDRLGERGAETT